MTPKNFRSLLVGLALAGLTACGSDTPPAGTDAGMTDGGGGTDAQTGSDAGTDARTASTAGTCAMPRATTLTVGAQQITGDTTGAPSAVDLGADCGNGPVGQDVLALTLPAGSGNFGVELSLVTEGTSTMFDTVLQTRTACDSDEGSQCFDDADPFAGELRSAGSVVAAAGSTIFVVVTGYAESMDAQTEGAYALDVTVSPATPPTATSATAVLIDGNDLRVTADGMDADGDIVGVAVELMDASGTVVGLDVDDPPDGMVDVTTIRLRTTEDLTGMTSVGAAARVSFAGLESQLTTVTQVRVALLDALELSSGTVMATLTRATSAGLSDACDATHICADGLSCTAGTCQLSAAAMATCTAATALTVTAAAPTTVMGTLAATDGGLQGTCQAASAAEVAYTVAVPAGNFDLIATTTGMTTGMTDTVLYAQTTCGDPTAEVACNDDISSGVLSSSIAIENATGTYTLVVDRFAEETPAEAAMFDLTVSLRPVLATGAACDPMGVTNRCAMGACPAMMSVCP